MDVRGRCPTQIAYFLNQTPCLLFVSLLVFVWVLFEGVVYSFDNPQISFLGMYSTTYLGTGQDAIRYTLYFLTACGDC